MNLDTYRQFTMDELKRKLYTLERPVLWYSFKPSYLDELFVEPTKAIIVGHIELIMNLLLFNYSKVQLLEKTVTHLKIENNNLKKELDIANKTLKKTRTEHLYKKRLESGYKPAYKEKYTCEQIKDFLDKGYSVNKIANILHVSRNLVNNRIKQLEEMGITKQN